MAKNHEGTTIEIMPGMKVSLDIQLKNDIDGRSILTLGSIVEELLEDGGILIHTPIYRGVYYPLPRDESIMMKLFSDSGLYAAQIQFEGRVERDSFMFARVRRIGRIVEHQQRDCYRFQCSLPVTFKRFWQSEIDEDSESVPVVGRMIDFSDGGMLFTTDENLEKGEKITLTFDIGTAETIESLILRTDKIEDGKYLFKVAARFMKEDRNQRRRFYKYIVNQQLAQRRR